MTLSRSALPVGHNEVIHPVLASGEPLLYGLHKAYDHRVEDGELRGAFGGYHIKGEILVGFGVLDREGVGAGQVDAQVVEGARRGAQPNNDKRHIFC